MIYFIIYVLSCPSVSFFAPLYSTHSVDSCRILLMPSFPNLAFSTGVRLGNLESVRPAIPVVICSSCRSLPLPYRFDLDLECCDFARELCDEGMCCFKLGCKFCICRGERRNRTAIGCRCHCELRNCFRSFLHWSISTLFYHRVSAMETRLLCGLVGETEFAMSCGEIDFKLGPCVGR
jgi:hypothetical protein